MISGRIFTSYLQIYSKFFETLNFQNYPSFEHLSKLHLKTHTAAWHRQIDGLALERKLLWSSRTPNSIRFRKRQAVNKIQFQKTEFKCSTQDFKWLQADWWFASESSTILYSFSVDFLMVSGLPETDFEQRNACWNSFFEEFEGNIRFIKRSPFSTTCLS